MPHPIENIMHSSMEQLKGIADVNTVVGVPIRMQNDAVILPISKVSLGFMSGGGEYDLGKGPVRKSGDMLDQNGGAYPFGGAAAAGVSLTPVGFLYVDGESVHMLNANCDSPLQRIVDALPQALRIAERILKEKKAAPQDAADAMDDEDA